jgi:hypothetical protein
MLNKTMKHEHSKGEEMETSQGVRQALIVTSEATKACHPTEAAFYDPAAREKNKAFLRLGQLDDFKTNAMLLGFVSRDITRVALPSSQRRLQCARQSLPELVAPTARPERDPGHRRVSHTAPANGPAYRPPCGSYCLCAASRRHTPPAAHFPGLDCSVRLSKIAALGWWFRPSASRSTTRRSCTIASNTPAFSQRCVCWYTISHGGRSLGNIRHVAPLRMM